MSAIQLTNCPRCGHQKWKYLGNDRAEEPPCGVCIANNSTFTCIEQRHDDCGGRTITGPCLCPCHPQGTSDRTEPTDG